MEAALARELGLSQRDQLATVQAVRRTPPANAALIEWFKYGAYDRRKLTVAPASTRDIACVLEQSGKCAP